MAFIISTSESMMGDWSRVHNRTARCAPLRSPLVGTLTRVSGDGVSVGTVMSLQCPVRHRPVGDARMSCVWNNDSNNTHWSGGTPVCRPLSRFEDEGFRLALLVSFISSAIILFMSIIFLTSCLVRHVKREERRKMERARKSGASEFWQQMEVEEVELQRQMLPNQKTTNNNNNNNNNRGEIQYTGTSQTTDKPICALSDLHDPYRHLQLYPQNIHLSQPPVIVHPAWSSAALPLSWDVQYCGPLWSTQEPLRPHRAPVHIVNV